MVSWKKNTSNVAFQRKKEEKKERKATKFEKIEKRRKLSTVKAAYSQRHINTH